MQSMSFVLVYFTAVEGCGWSVLQRFSGPVSVQGELRHSKAFPSTSETFLDPVLAVLGSIPVFLWTDLCIVNTRHPRHFRHLSLLTHITPSVLMLCRAWLSGLFQCTKKPRSITQTALLEENAMALVLLQGWDRERRTGFSCAAQWCITGCVDTFDFFVPV